MNTNKATDCNCSYVGNTYKFCDGIQLRYSFLEGVKLLDKLVPESTYLKGVIAQTIRDMGVCDPKEEQQLFHSMIADFQVQFPLYPWTRRGHDPLWVSAFYALADEIDQIFEEYSGLD